MTHPTTSRLSPIVILTICALLVALSGTAYAAGKASGDTLIKESSLSGNRLKSNTVTGRQVKEATLAAVPRAKRSTTADVAKSLPIPVHATLALKPGWVEADYNPNVPTWSRDLSGFVHLEGAVQRTAPGDTVAVLPARARPPVNIYVPVYTFNSTTGSASISTNGAITILSGDDSYVSLEGITFRAR